MSELPTITESGARNEALLARLDERTGHILELIKGLATKFDNHIVEDDKRFSHVDAGVAAVKQGVEDEIDSTRDRVNYAAGAVGVIVILAGLASAWLRH